MTPAHEREPSRDDLLAMAYVDGELPAEETRAFEQRLAREPALALEVAAQRRLELVARRMAPIDPAEAEWRRLRRDPFQRGATLGGFAALGAGILGLALFGAYRIAVAPGPSLLVKVLLALGCTGAALLFLSVLRSRLRILPYDPYTDVER